MGPDSLGARSPDDWLDAPEAGLIAIRGGALRITGYVSGIVIGLVSAPLLLRHLGVVDFGRYTVVLSIVTLAAGVTEGGLTAIGLREYSLRDAGDRDQLMRQLLGIRLVLTVGGVAIAAVIAVAAGYERELVLGTLVVGVGLLLQSVQSLLSVALGATLRFGWVTLAELVRQVATVCAIVALVLAGAGLLPFFAVQVPAGLLALALTVAVVRNLMPLRPSFDRTRWLPLVRDVLPFTAATAVNIVYFRVTIVVVSLAASAQQTGYFATSQRILETLVGIPALIVSAVFPMLARSAAETDPARIRHLIGRILEVATIFGVWMALSLILAARPIIAALAGAAYEPAVDVLRIQALALVATFLAIGCQFPLLALHRYRALLIANLAALLASVTLASILVPLYEARGGAIATVAAELALAVTTGVLLTRADRGLRLPIRIVLPVLFAAAAAGSLTFVPWLPDAAVAVLGSVVYFGILIATRRMPPEVLHAFRLRRSPVGGST